MRMRKKKNAELRLSACEQYLVRSREEILALPNWLPCALEIGCGKGGFICELAKRNPDRYYLALEVSTSALITALERAQKEKLPNLRFINANATQLSSFFEKGEISELYLNFSDPWPKARHYKRRLTYRTFLESYRDCMASNGVIYLKTDNRDFFAFSQEECAALGFTVTDITHDLHHSEYAVENIMTEYEKNFSERGLSIQRMVIHVK